MPDHVELTIEGSEVTMLVPDDVLFDFDEYELKKEAKDTLDDIILTLTRFDKEVEIAIDGHTDNVGNEDYNLELSEKRAQEVKKYLTKDGQLQDGQIKTRGLGDSKPIASNETESGQAKNRRVEIVINFR